MREQKGRLEAAVISAGRQLKAATAQRDEQKGRLEAAVFSAGRQLKAVTAQRDNLVKHMEERVADETARHLEQVYAPLLEAYKQKCGRLEEQLGIYPSAQPGLAQHPAASTPTPQRSIHLPETLGL